MKAQLVYLFKKQLYDDAAGSAKYAIYCLARLDELMEQAQGLGKRDRKVLQELIDFLEEVRRSSLEYLQKTPTGK